MRTMLCSFMSSTCLRPLVQILMVGSIWNIKASTPTWETISSIIPLTMWRLHSECVLPLPRHKFYTFLWEISTDWLCCLGFVCDASHSFGEIVPRNLWRYWAPRGPTCCPCLVYLTGRKGTIRFHEFYILRNSGIHLKSICLNNTFIKCHLQTVWHLKKGL